MPSDPAALPASESSTESSSGSSSGPSPGRGSRLISRLLPPAIRLWLHTQLDHIEGLEFAIDGQDRQILGGYLPGVNLVARQAVYQGLYVSQAQVQAADIRVNLPQVLRGKALRLLQPFPVTGQVTMGAEDLRLSLRSPLLAQGLQDVLKQLLAGAATPMALDQWLEPGDGTAAIAITLEPDRLTLGWPPSQLSGDRLELTTGLVMAEGRRLCLWQPVAQVISATNDAPTQVSLEDVIFDLGPEVDIHTLTVGPAGLELVGTVRVIPAD